MGLVMSDMWAMHAIISCLSLCCMSMFVKPLPSAPGTSPFAYSTCLLSFLSAVWGVWPWAYLFSFFFILLSCSPKGMPDSPLVEPLRAVGNGGWFFLFSFSLVLYLSRRVSFLSFLHCFSPLGLRIRSRF